MQLKDFINKNKNAIALVCGFLAVGVLGAIDYMAGPEIPLLLFYLIPIFVVTWIAGVWAGFSLSLASSILWLTKGIATQEDISHITGLYWDVITKLALFVIFSYIVAALSAALKREREAVGTDLLTGVTNRKAFYDVANNEIHRTKRYKHPFTVAYMDIDNLKMVNYRLGHSAGDSLLKLVAHTIKSNLRDVDVVSRFGGDEFALLLPETSSEGAQVLLSRLRNKLLEVMQKNALSTTFSFGAVTFISPPDSVEEMIKKAGILMYSAKDSGPNMIDQDVFEKKQP